MDHARIRTRHFQHGNSLKRIAFDYSCSVAEIADICGLAIGSAEPAPQIKAVPAWFEVQAQDVQALIHWACEQAGLALEDFTKKGTGRAVRIIVAWHLVHIWGLETRAIAEIIGCGNSNVPILAKLYEPTKRCPVEPVLPRLPHDYLAPLLLVAGAHGVSPLAVYNRVLPEKRAVWRIYVAELAKGGKSIESIAAMLEVDPGTVQRAINNAAGVAAKANRPKPSAIDGGKAHAA